MEKIMEKYMNMYERIKGFAETRPDYEVYVCVDIDLNKTPVTYKQLFDVSVDAAAGLQANGVCSGERCVLIFDQNEEMIYSFFSVIFAGGVAVPYSYPDNAKKVENLISVIDDCGAKAVMTNRVFKAAVTEMFADRPDIKVYTLDDVTGRAAEYTEAINDVQLLQYTSGSTGNPKGVTVTRLSLAANTAGLVHCFNLDRENIIVTWLPYNHDIFLICDLIGALYINGKIVIMKPADFFVAPLNWMKLVTEFKATMIDGPNSAYGLIAQKLAEEPDGKYDLSNMDRASCGSEPIHVELLSSFMKQAGRYGLVPDAILPGYGLAENTVLGSVYKYNYGGCGCVAVDKRRMVNGEVFVRKRFKFVDAPVEIVENNELAYLIGNGVKLLNHEIRVMDASGNITDKPLTLGEICLFGDSVADGYWNNPEASAEVFFTDENSARYVRTGDMGFLDENGELYISGRKKELIIIRGKNFYPYDIEKTVYSSSDKLKINGSAAFSVTRNMQEALVVLQEVHNDCTPEEYDEAANCIRRAVAESHGLVVSSLVLLKQDSIPRTSSTKVQRNAAKVAFENGAVKGELRRYEYLTDFGIEMDEFYSEDDATDYIVKLIAGFLAVSEDDIDVSAAFTDIGLNSLAFLQLSEVFSTNLNLEIKSHEFFEYYTPEKLGGYIYGLLSEN
jgi:acyl-CoA synthetase (AMP-forming)/AMP-acid ligase II/acyl carrier protein